MFPTMVATKKPSILLQKLLSSGTRVWDHKKKIPSFHYEAHKPATQEGPSLLQTITVRWTAEQALIKSFAVKILPASRNFNPLSQNLVAWATHATRHRNVPHLRCIHQLAQVHDITCTNMPPKSDKTQEFSVYSSNRRWNARNRTAGGSSLIFKMALLQKCEIIMSNLWPG